jgi:hypothetical protein
MASASDTLIILDALGAKGIDDQALTCLHHFRESGMAIRLRHTLATAKIASFAEGSGNHKVQQWLALVLRTQVLGGKGSDEPATRQIALHVVCYQARAMRD